MSNWPLMFQPLAKYAQFQGRSRRSEFWLWVLFRIILGMVLSTIMNAIFMGPMLGQIAHMSAAANNDPSAFMQSYSSTFGNYLLFMPLIWLIGIALLIPTLAVGVRRLHDTNRSGWWILLPHVVAFVGLIIFFIVAGASLFSMFAAHPDGNNIPDSEGVKVVLQVIGSLFLFVFLPTIIALIVLLVFYVSEGTKGPNRFGPDPKPVETF